MGTSMVATSEGAGMNPEWQNYLNGHWQREMPQKSGTYKTTDALGHEAGWVVVYKQDSEGLLMTKLLGKTKSAGGYRCQPE